MGTSKANEWLMELRMENASKRELFSKETRELFALGARLITDDWVKYKVMCDLEFVHSKIPSTMLHIPRKLDESLAKDGYQMKKGKLLRLKL